MYAILYSFSSPNITTPDFIKDHKVKNVYKNKLHKIKNSMVEKLH